ncbi:chaperone protein dnaJ 11 chloroplastic [Tripterygium wilfordii]|uniref:Chaperone protein dnaJ 11 chloroplastic n=1 Tax=Tripterygium wilfordii TaxID=458696 RepID=A0A7J7C924_TRIWF|nr:chaperone protein dnaJ 11, chloroplastic [Tripterygium wilfordii]KAF5730435.1 chaperone protein dnaJ 11 chloroplastic [Tripterygium wilfordii]
MRTAGTLAIAGTLTFPRPLSTPPPKSLQPRRKMYTTVNAVTAEPISSISSSSSSASASLYDILRVKHDASVTEIKSAYRSLAKRYHPDAARRQESGEDGRDFIEIHNAYATLTDPAARALYDMSLGGRGDWRRWRERSAGFYTTRRWETDQCW